jgi:hypothetical protein
MDEAQKAGQSHDINGGRLILQTEAVRLWYHAASGIVHHRLETVPDSESFRALLLAGAELLERERAQKWLSDDRKNLVVRDPDSEWARQVWLPRVLRSGFKFWAIVLPTAAIGKLNMRRFAAEYSKIGLNVNAVDSPETAFDWLRSFPVRSPDQALPVGDMRRRQGNPKL